MSKRKEKIKDITQESIHDYLIMQIKGYLDIELGKIVYLYGLDIGYHTGDGINVFIKDPKYCEKDSKDPLLFLKGYEDDKYDDLMIGHYHYEDILWLLLNLKDEAFKMGLDIRKYLRENNIPLKNKEINY